MKKILCLLLTAVAVLGSVWAAAPAAKPAAKPKAKWAGLAEKNHVAGPKIAEADFAGKLHMVCYVRNNTQLKQAMTAMDKITRTFTGKPFVGFMSVIGRDVWAVAQLTEDQKKLLTSTKPAYGVYTDAKPVDNAPMIDSPFFFQVFNHRGKSVATAAGAPEAIEAITDAYGLITGGATSLYGTVALKRFKGMRTKMQLGKSMKDIMKALEKESKNKNDLIAAEASDLISAIEEAKANIEEEIEAQKESNPLVAARLIRLYMKSWAADGAKYKDELPELDKAAKEKAAEEKAAKAAAAKK